MQRLDVTFERQWNIIDASANTYPRQGQKESVTWYFSNINTSPNQLTPQKCSNDSGKGIK